MTEQRGEKPISKTTFAHLPKNPSDAQIVRAFRAALLESEESLLDQAGRIRHGGVKGGKIHVTMAVVVSCLLIEPQDTALTQYAYTPEQLEESKRLWRRLRELHFPGLEFPGDELADDEAPEVDDEAFPHRNLG